MIQVPRLGLWVASVACIVSFASVPTWADFAPDSIGGMVYRDTYFVPSIRTGYERTIIFEPSGRFIWVKEAGLFTVSENFAQGRFLLRAPRSDGTYVYSKTTPSSANVALTFDDASDPLVLYLGFTSPTGGALGNPIHPDLSFTLTEQATIRSAPAVNISTRGVVTPGHPMIVGFVVPGTPVSEYSDHVTSPHANRRDVLIRAVGPSLAAFGVANVCANPDFALHRSDGPSYLGPFSPFQFHYPDWSSIERPDAAGPRTRSPNPAGMAAFKKIFAQVGAFPLLDDSNDAAAVVRLAPGAYTVVATAGANDTGGEILVEVYFLP